MLWLRAGWWRGVGRRGIERARFGRRGGFWWFGGGWLCVVGGLASSSLFGMDG